MQRTQPILSLPSTEPGATDFLWATGVEDTFISAPHPTTGRILDEYALTQHYERWEEDLGLIASLGVTSIRYGIPWYRVEPQPGVFDWEWTDRVLETLVQRHGIEPIVDLMHYGTPVWLENSFLSASYPGRVAEYAHAFAERYKGLCYWYTPLNEPRINAWYAGRLGWWPPYGRSWKMFAAVLTAIARGIVETQRAIGSVEPSAVFVHVDATDLYKTDDPSLESERAMRQEIVFLALDLVQGRVGESHPLLPWLEKCSIAKKTLSWHLENRVCPDVIGYNMYPMYSEKHLRRDAQGRLTVTIRRCGGETFEALTRLYADRYGLPVMCTETASNGSPSARIRWIDQVARSVDRLRADGVPLVGMTYWPLFSLAAWQYQRGQRSLEESLIHMGLWDLRADPADPSALLRTATPAADAYRKSVSRSVIPLGVSV